MEQRQLHDAIGSLDDPEQANSIQTSSLINTSRTILYYSSARLEMAKKTHTHACHVVFSLVFTPSVRRSDARHRAEAICYEHVGRCTLSLSEKEELVVTFGSAKEAWWNTTPAWGSERELARLEMRELLFILSAKVRGTRAERNFKKSFGAFFFLSLKALIKWFFWNNDLIRTRIRTRIY